MWRVGVQGEIVTSLREHRGGFKAKYVRPRARAWSSAPNVAPQPDGARGPNPHKLFAFEPGLFHQARQQSRRTPNSPPIVSLRLGLGDRTGRSIGRGPNQSGQWALASRYGRSAGHHPRPFFRDKPLIPFSISSIDVNGMEFEVLPSARETLRAHHPVIYYAPT